MLVGEPSVGVVTMAGPSISGTAFDRFLRVPAEVDSAPSDEEVGSVDDLLEGGAVICSFVSDGGSSGSASSAVSELPSDALVSESDGVDEDCDSCAWESWDVADGEPDWSPADESDLAAEFVIPADGPLESDAVEPPVLDVEP